jgi:RND family efflux transporter MFP subunit
VVERQLKQAGQQLVEASSLRDLVLEGTRPERIEQFEAKVETQRQLINQLKDRLEKFTIVAPFGGFVITEFVERGAWVKAGDPIAELVQIDPIEVEVFVPEQQVVAIRPNEPAPVTLAALPGQVFSGRIAQIVPLANVQSRTFPVRIVVENPLDDSGLPIMRVGMLASVQLAAERPRRAMLVPKDALRLDTRPLQVVRVLNGQADPVEVEIGASRGSMVEAITISGTPLQAGDLLVVRGNEGLLRDQPVQIIEQLRSEASFEQASE